MHFRMGMGTPGLMEFVIILIWLLVVILPFWKIFSKAGFSGALSLLMLIPLVNVVMIFFLAFANWPALKSDTATDQDQGRTL